MPTLSRAMDMRHASQISVHIRQAGNEDIIQSLGLWGSAPCAKVRSGAGETDSNTISRCAVANVAASVACDGWQHVTGIQGTHGLSCVFHKTLIG